MNINDKTQTTMQRAFRFRVYTNEVTLLVRFMEVVLSGKLEIVRIKLTNTIRGMAIVISTIQHFHWDTYRTFSRVSI